MAISNFIKDRENPIFIRPTELSKPPASLNAVDYLGETKLTVKTSPT